MKAPILKIGDIYENKSLQRIYLILSLDSKIRVGTSGCAYAVRVLILKSPTSDGRTSVGRALFVSKNFLRKEAGTIKIG